MQIYNRPTEKEMTETKQFSKYKADTSHAYHLTTELLDWNSIFTIEGLFFKGNSSRDGRRNKGILRYIEATDVTASIQETVHLEGQEAHENVLIQQLHEQLTW